MPVTFSRKVPPVFSAPIDPTIDLIVGTARQWTLPAPDYTPFQPDSSESIIALIIPDLVIPLTFDTQSYTFSWSADTSIYKTIHEKYIQVAPKVVITLKNENGDKSDHE